MVRKTLLTGILAVAMVVVMAGTASAAPTVTTLSSWESIVVDGQIVGGHRTITVTNILDTPTSDQTIGLTEVPCECDVVGTSIGATIENGSWLVPHLEPGETATLMLVYGETAERAPIGVTPNSPLMLAGLLAAVTVAALVGLTRRPVLAPLPSGH